MRVGPGLFPIINPVGACDWVSQRNIFPYSIPPIAKKSPLLSNSPKSNSWGCILASLKIEAFISIIGSLNWFSNSESSSSPLK